MSFSLFLAFLTFQVYFFIFLAAVVVDFSDVPRGRAGRRRGGGSALAADPPLGASGQQLSPAKRLILVMAMVMSYYGESWWFSWIIIYNI